MQIGPGKEATSAFTAALPTLHRRAISVLQAINNGLRADDRGNRVAHKVPHLYKKKTAPNFS